MPQSLATRLRTKQTRAARAATYKRKSYNWGGKRPGAGRKKGTGGKKHGPRTDRDAFYDYARSCSLVAIDRLVEIITVSKNEAVAIQAAQVLLDRAWGKPAQAIGIEASMHHQLDVNEKARDPRTLAMAILAVLREAQEDMRDEANDDVLLPAPRANPQVAATPRITDAEPATYAGGRRVIDNDPLPPWTSGDVDG